MLIDFLNLNVQVPSRQTLVRDLEEIYQEYKEHVFQQLYKYIYNGGRVTLITDCWSANNRKEYRTVTAYIVEKDS